MDAISNPDFWKSIALAASPFVLALIAVGIWQGIDDYQNSLAASMRRHPAGKGRKS